VIRTPFKAPNANAHAERWVRTVRAECLDWLLIVGRRQLEQVLTPTSTITTASAPTVRSDSCLHTRRASRYPSWTPVRCRCAEGIGSAGSYTSTSARLDDRVYAPYELVIVHGSSLLPRPRSLARSGSATFTAEMSKMTMSCATERRKSRCLVASIATGNAAVALAIDEAHGAGKAHPASVGRGSARLTPYSRSAILCPMSEALRTRSTLLVVVALLAGGAGGFALGHATGESSTTVLPPPVGSRFGTETLSVPSKDRPAKKLRGDSPPPPHKGSRPGAAPSK
jgi:hypothetical protein